MPYYHERKLPRLQGYDYTQPNFYFVTICTAKHRCLFGRPGTVNALGHIAQTELLCVPAHYRNVRIDKYVIMPNHVHVIFVLEAQEGLTANPTLSTVVGQYKSAVSKAAHELYPGLPVWQKSFYEEVIRNKAHYLAVWNYIEGNPLKWDKDEYFTLQ